MTHLNDAVHALVHVADTPVHDSAAAARPDALLAGVDIGVKDLIDVAGMPTRLGSLAVSRLPTRHADAVAALTREGARIIGKCHTTEFAMSGWGVSPLGRPLNPIDADDRYFTGGSSNGSASAVASGLARIALGTDTGGSVRIPSSWCGITGLKGSPGWISTEGVAPLSQSFDVVGPMAHGVEDVTRAYRAMLPAARRLLLDRESQRLAQASLPVLNFIEDAVFHELDGEVRAVYRASQARCEALGFAVRTVSLPCRFEDMAATWATISSVEGYLNNRVLADDPASALDPGARQNLLQGRTIDLDSYFRALDRARHYRDQINDVVLPDGLLVVPTTSTAAMRLDAFDGARTLGLYTRFVNLIQGCALALPNGFTADGRPTSMQFVGAYGYDAAVLRAAAHWQSNTDWHLRTRQRHAEQMARRIARMAD